MIKVSEKYYTTMNEQAVLASPNDLVEMTVHKITQTSLKIKNSPGENDIGQLNGKRFGDILNVDEENETLNENKTGNVVDPICYSEINTLPNIVKCFDSISYAENEGRDNISPNLKQQQSYYKINDFFPKKPNLKLKKIGPNGILSCIDDSKQTHRNKTHCPDDEICESIFDSKNISTTYNERMGQNYQHGFTNQTEKVKCLHCRREDTSLDRLSNYKQVINFETNICCNFVPEKSVNFMNNGKLENKQGSEARTVENTNLPSDCDGIGHYMHKMEWNGNFESENNELEDDFNENVFDPSRFLPLPHSGQEIVNPSSNNIAELVKNLTSDVQNYTRNSFIDSSNHVMIEEFSMGDFLVDQTIEYHKIEQNKEPYMKPALFPNGSDVMNKVMLIVKLLRSMGVEVQMEEQPQIEQNEVNMIHGIFGDELDNSDDRDKIMQLINSPTTTGVDVSLEHSSMLIREALAGVGHKEPNISEILQPRNIKDLDEPYYKETNDESTQEILQPPNMNELEALKVNKSGILLPNINNIVKTSNNFKSPYSVVSSICCKTGLYNGIKDTEQKKLQGSHTSRFETNGFPMSNLEITKCPNSDIYVEPFESINKRLSEPYVFLGNATEDITKCVFSKQLNTERNLTLSMGDEAVETYFKYEPVHGSTYEICQQMQEKTLQEYEEKMSSHDSCESSSSSSALDYVLTIVKDDTGRSVQMQPRKIVANAILKRPDKNVSNMSPIKGSVNQRDHAHLNQFDSFAGITLTDQPKWLSNTLKTESLVNTKQIQKSVPFENKTVLNKNINCVSPTLSSVDKAICDAYTSLNLPEGVVGQDSKRTTTRQLVALGCDLYDQDFGTETHTPFSTLDASKQHISTNEQLRSMQNTLNRLESNLNNVLQDQNNLLKLVMKVVDRINVPQSTCIAMDCHVPRVDEGSVLSKQTQTNPENRLTGLNCSLLRDAKGTDLTKELLTDRGRGRSHYQINHHLLL